MSGRFHIAIEQMACISNCEAAELDDTNVPIHPAADAPLKISDRLLCFISHVIIGHYSLY